MASIDIGQIQRVLGNVSCTCAVCREPPLEHSLQVVKLVGALCISAEATGAAVADCKWQTTWQLSAEPDSVVPPGA